MPKQNKYVVVDWGSWGIDFQSSSNIVVDDYLNVKEGDKCSLQGKDPATKRPTMFHGQVLAVFGTKKEAETKVTELVSPPEAEGVKETHDGARPRRHPKPSKKKLAELEDDDEDEEPKPTKKRQEPVVSKSKKKKTEMKTDDNKIVAVANAKRVKHLLLRRQHCTGSNEDTDGTEIIEVEEVRDKSGTNMTSEQLNSLPPGQSSDGRFSSPLQPPGIVDCTPGSPHQSSDGTNNTPVGQSTNGSYVSCRQSSDVTILTPPPSQTSKLTNNTPVRQSTNGSYDSCHQSSGVIILTPPPHQTSNGTTNTPVHHSSNGSFNSLQQSSGVTDHSSPLQFPNGTNNTPPCNSVNGFYNSSSQSSELTTYTPSPRQYSPQASMSTPQQEFSFLQSLRHCSDYDISDLDQIQTSGIRRDDSQQRAPAFSSLAACSSCQPLLMSLNNRLSSLEAEFEKLKRKHRKGKNVLDSEVVEKKDENEDRFNGFTKGSLMGSVDDASDAKTAVDILAKQMFLTNELQSCSVTGFQCNKAYESRPGLSPTRRNLLESIILKKNFPATTRSSVRKDLSLVLKKARANKDNIKKAKLKEQDRNKL